MSALEQSGLDAAEREAHERRLGYLAEHGWELVEEGLVKDTSDLRWSNTKREIVEYTEGLSFEEAVKIAWRHQKCLEATELAERQRKGRKS